MGVALLADIHWNDATLMRVDWGEIKKPGDEEETKRQEMADGVAKTEFDRTWDHHAAVRANRQLANMLQAQGLNEDAARFAFRAQILQRKIFWKQRDVDKWFLLSWPDTVIACGASSLPISSSSLCAR